MANKTPTLYATGVWTVKSPFMVVGDAIYTCQAIRSISDIEAMGQDPFAKFYEPFGISEADYEKDKANLPNIITLMSDTQRTVYIPDTYIQSYPKLDTVPYRHAVLSISLGPVPDSMVFDDLTDKVENLVTNAIGVEGTAKIHQASYVAQSVTLSNHMALEATRKLKIAENTTEYAKALALQNRVQELEEQIARLEQVIVDNDLEFE